MLTDKEIVDGIALDNNKVLSFVYKEMFPYVEAYIAQHGGSLEQAEDVFQDAMIIVYKKIADGKFSLHCKFSTYLYAVCKHIWIQDRKKYYLRINKLKETSILSEPEVSYGIEKRDDAKEIFEKHFRKLSPDCQKILRMFFNGISMEEIRIEMGISTVHHTADKKYRCKKNLVDRIQGDPKFIKFKNE